MKKAVVLLTLVLLVFSLCSCDLPLPPAPPESKAYSLTELWVKIGGAYADISTESANYGELAVLSISGGECVFHYGTLYTDFYEGGIVSDFTAESDTLYKMKVNIPAREASMLNDAVPAYTLDIKIDISGEENFVTFIYITEGGPVPVELERLGDSLEDISEVHINERLDLSRIFEILDGVWVYDEPEYDMFGLMMYFYDNPESGDHEIYFGYIMSEFFWTAVAKSSTALGDGAYRLDLTITTVGYEDEPVETFDATITINVSNAMYEYIAASEFPKESEPEGERIFRFYGYDLDSASNAFHQHFDDIE